MSNGKTDYNAKYEKWIEKKIDGRPPAMAKFLRRSYHSGLMVLSELDGLPFDRLSSSLYFLCQDMQTEQLSRKYEALLELAGASPDRFMMNIHKELNGISRYIKENDLMPEFCEFISACDRLRCIRSTTDMDVWHIMTAYMDLLLQTCAYLNPSKFNFQHRFCGCSTDGEPLLCDEYYPYADDIVLQATKELENKGVQRGIADFDNSVARIASMYGCPELSSALKTQCVMMQDVYHSAQIATMITYVNEYTYDMLPDTDHLFDQNIKALEALSVVPSACDALFGKLMSRVRTLPSNGLLITFSCENSDTVPDRLESLIMKEVLHDDRIVMLYKLRFSDQDISGYYDTKDEFFHSLFLEMDGPVDTQVYHEKMQSVILYLYTAATSRDAEQMFSEFASMFCYTDGADNPCCIPISVEPFYRGGKLRNTYLESERPYNPTGARLGNDKYEQAERSIQGYIRKVGAGRTPSKEAVARAEALGFFLEPDETYVQPFTRRVLRLKRK